MKGGNYPGYLSGSNLMSNRGEAEVDIEPDSVIFYRE